MNEDDLQKLIELTKKAADCGNYSIAALLRDARNLLNKQLNDKWAEQILNNIQAS